MAHFTRGVQRVGVDHHQARTQCTKHRNRVLQDIGHLYRDAITGHQVGVLLQITGKRRAMAIKLGIGQGDPEVTEGRPVCKFFAGALKDIHH